MNTILTTLSTALLDGSVRVVDLTHTLSPDFPTIMLPPQFGQSAPFSSVEISCYDERGPAWYWNNFTCGEHTGTHFDAPAHWITGRALPDNTVDKLSPSTFVAPAVVIDLSAQAAANPDALLTRELLEAWEEAHGRIPARHWVLLRTDWGKRSGAAYANVSEDGAHTPGPNPDAMRFLVEERDILGFGTETIGTDAGQAHLFDPPYPAHAILHGNGRYGLQCLTGLDQLPATGSIIMAAPLKIQNGSGSPLRVTALIPG